MPSNISVIIPTYNVSKTIDETLESIVNQTLKPDKIIIVDDKSTDDSWNKLSAWQKKHSDLIEIYQNKKNSGAAVTRNNCLSHVKTKYVAPIDADDLWHPDRLKIMKQHLEKTGNYGCLTDGYYIHDSKLDKSISLFEDNAKFPKDNLIDAPFIIKYPMPYSQYLCEIKKIHQIGGYNNQLRRSQDMDFLVRLLNTCGPLDFVKDKVYYYRADQPESLSGNKLKAAPWHLKFLRNRLKEDYSISLKLNIIIQICGVWYKYISHKYHLPKLHFLRKIRKNI